jgi:hypothetical protein
MELLKWARVQWDRVAAILAAATGALALFVGWVRIGGEVFPAKQLPLLISGGVGGLFLLGVGATLWLSAELRDQWHKLDGLERQLGERDALSGGGVLNANGDEDAGDRSTRRDRPLVSRAAPKPS